MMMGFSPPPTVLYTSPVSTLPVSSQPPSYVAPRAGAVVRASAAPAISISRSRTTAAPEKKSSHVPFQVSSLATLGLSVATEEQALRRKDVCFGQVTSVAWGGPAHLSGVIEEGDKLIAIDGEPLHPESIIERLRGDDKVGSSCHLVLTRERGGAEFSIRLTRVFAEDVARASDIHSMVQNVRGLAAKLPAMTGGRSEIMAGLDDLVDALRTREHRREEREDCISHLFAKNNELEELLSLSQTETVQRLASFQDEVDRLTEELQIAKQMEWPRRDGSNNDRDRAAERPMSEQGREANGDGDAVKPGPPKTYQQASAQTDSLEASHETNSLRTDKAAPQNPPAEAPPPPRQPGRMSTEEAPPAQGEFDPDQVRRLIALIKGERMMEMPAKILDHVQTLEERVSELEYEKRPSPISLQTATVSSTQTSSPSQRKGQAASRPADNGPTLSPSNAHSLFESPAHGASQSLGVAASSPLGKGTPLAQPRVLPQSPSRQTRSATAIGEVRAQQKAVAPSDCHAHSSKVVDPTAGRTVNQQAMDPPQYQAHSPKVVDLTTGRTIHQQAIEPQQYQAHSPGANGRSTQPQHAIHTQLPSPSSRRSRQKGPLIGRSVSSGEGGVGLGLEVSGGRVVVREVLEGSSADLDGRIRIDDEVVSVCGADVSNLSARQVTQLVLGEAGTRVVLDMMTVDGNEAKGRRKRFTVVLLRTPPSGSRFASSDSHSSPFKVGDRAGSWDSHSSPSKVSSGKGSSPSKPTRSSFEDIYDAADQLFGLFEQQHGSRS